MRYIFFGIIYVYFIFQPTLVWAHPIDEVDGAKVYDQKQTLVVGTQTTLSIDLTIYAIEKNRIWESIDRNKDRLLSPQEKTRWMNLGASSSYVTTSSEDKILFTPSELLFPEYYDYFARPPAKIRIDFISSKQLSAGSKYQYHYEGKDKSLAEINAELKGTDGFIVKDVTRSDSNSLSFMVVQGDEDSGTVLGIQTNSRLNHFLSAYVKRDTLPNQLLFVALGAAFVIGALHALTPGHGKAIVASYLVGSQGTAWHAVNLALIITITHTASVFLLGVASLILTEYFVPMTVVRVLNYVSGALIVVFGSVLLWQRTRRIRQDRHLHRHNHHADHQLHHDHTHSISLTWKNLIPMGISGGIVPCVDALAILVVAATLGKIVFGIGILIAFSIGLAVALTVAGLVAVVAKDTIMRRWNGITQYEQYLGVFSAGVVTLLGIAMLLGIYI